MTDERAIEEPEWKRLLRISFGLVDRIFCTHPLERERAREMLAEVLRTGVSLTEVEEEARRFLLAEGCGRDHVKEQLQRMNRLGMYFNR